MFAALLKIFEVSSSPKIKASFPKNPLPNLPPKISANFFRFSTDAVSLKNSFSLPKSTLDSNDGASTPTTEFGVKLYFLIERTFESPAF